MLAGKGRNFAAVSADGHRAPAAAVCARFVIEEEATQGVGAQPEPRPGTFGNQFRCGTGYGSQQPVEAALASDELNLPGASTANQFVVSFGYAEDLIDGLAPISGDLLLSMHGREYFVKRGAEALGLPQQAFSGLWVGLRQSQKLGAALRRHDARSFEE
jgi:hypothetical protein